MAQLIDGKKLAEDVVSTVKTETEKLVAATGIVPGIAVVIVGEDPASQVYVASKSRKAKECGFHSVQHDLPETASERELLDLIESLNNDPAIHGILVQLPLPRHIDSGRVIQTISPTRMSTVSISSMSESLAPARLKRLSYPARQRAR